MDNVQRLSLITQHLEEVLTVDELKHLVESGTKLRHYIGFEISGQIHLGTGLAAMMKVRDLQQAGVNCTIFLADWHSWINDKLGSNLDLIRKVAVGYFTEGIKASLAAIGGKPDKLSFVTGTALYHENPNYWATVIEISKNTTLSRVMRSISIMGRQAGEGIDFAKLIYPTMQAADIFWLEANIVHAGMDQRKAHVIARDVATQLKVKQLQDANSNVIKPIALHHHLLLGLQAPPKWPMSKEELQEGLFEMKMSKSKPNSAIFITDSEDEIRDKLNKAFAPEKETEYNPILDWTKHLIFPLHGRLDIARPEKWGGNVSFSSFADLEKLYAEGGVHPQDVKTAVAESLIEILTPIRDYFAKDPAKHHLAELKQILSA